MPHDGVRPGIEPAEVLRVDLFDHRLLVLGRRVLPLRLVLLENGEDVGEAASRSSLAYSMYEAMLAVMSEMTRPFRCFWYLSAYSIPSMPPQECRTGRSSRGRAPIGPARPPRGSGRPSTGSCRRAGPSRRTRAGRSSRTRCPPAAGSPRSTRSTRACTPGPPWRVSILILPAPTFFVQTLYFPSTG